MNIPKATVHFKLALKHLGHDVDREGLKDTPTRWVKFMREFMSPPNFKMTKFKNEGLNEMIVLENIPFFSLCEHHVAPFFGTATIAYIPVDTILGLSKLPRALDMIANNLQNQERITHKVGEYIMKQAHPLGVGVSLTARHLCMEMRGVKKHGTNTTTTALFGAFQKPEVKSEFLQYIRKNGK